MTNQPFDVEALPSLISIGRKTENNAEHIDFDISPWLEKWPGIVCHVLPTLPGEQYHYPAICVQEDNILRWNVSRSDTMREGVGRVAIQGVLGDVCKMSAETYTSIENNHMDMSSTPPDPAQPWVEKVLEAADAVQRAVAGDAVTADVTALGVKQNTDCSEVLTGILAKHQRLYFPAGVYTFRDVVVTQDTVLEMAPDAHFHVDAGCMLRAYNCSLTVRGGVISSGTKYDNRPDTENAHASRTLVYGKSNYWEGIITLYGCHDCVFEHITVPYSSSLSVIQLYGDSNGAGGNRPVTIGGNSVVPGACRNIRINNCSFNDFLLSAIHVLYHNKGVVIDGCTFTNALRPKGIAYCYTSYTGVMNINDDKFLHYTPTDGYVFRNCRVENCEGTGVDTHAASNVLYENNTFIDCDNFITAYHDYRRVRTADGWVMENVIVRNNRCKTTKAFDYASNAYPHYPFMLYNNGLMHTMRNLIVENNIIDTNWHYVSSSGNNWEVICVMYADDVQIRNNTVISSATVARGISAKGCSNLTIDNLTLVGGFDTGVLFETCVGKVGAIDCLRATFDWSVLYNRDDSIFCSVIDTEALRINNPLVAHVGGWEWVLNRYGRPLMALDSYLPLDGVTLSTDKGYTGKANIDGHYIYSIDGNRIELGANWRLPRGSCVALCKSGAYEAAASGPFYYIVDVESYYNAEDSKKFVAVLDRIVEDTTVTSMVIAVPKYDMYNEDGSDGVSLSVDENGDATISGVSLSVDENGDATISGGRFAVDESGNAVI